MQVERRISRSPPAFFAFLDMRCSADEGCQYGRLFFFHVFQGSVDRAVRSGVARFGRTIEHKTLDGAFQSLGFSGGQKHGRIR